MIDEATPSYAKAFDDLAAKVFIPSLIASLMVEFGPMYQDIQGAGLILVYLVCVISGAIIWRTIFNILSYGSAYLNGKNLAPFLAIPLMPLGFVGVAPEYFQEFSVSYSKVTGAAMLACSFVLLRRKGSSREIGRTSKSN